MAVLRSLSKNLFKRPYRWLPFAMFAYVILCFALHPLSPLHTGVLADPDDYMRLNEVINWLNGQGWFDLSHPRLSPGAHTVVHWSRLLDIPLLIFMLPFIGAFGVTKAALLSSFIVPSLLLLCLLALAPALARIFTGDERANIAAAMVLFAPSTLFNFTPGRVDHHGYQVLIAGFGLLCLDPIINDKRGWRYALAAAVAFACGMWIGTEIMPWLILFAACLGAMAAWQGGFALRNAAVFGVALAAAAAVALMLAVPPEDYFSRALSWFSSAYVIFALFTGAVFVMGWMGDRIVSNKTLRLFFMPSFGLIAAAMFIVLVPDVWKGPFTDYDDFDSTTALANINEARPLIDALHFNPYIPLTWGAAFVNAMHIVFLPLLGLGAIAYSLFHRAPTRERMVKIAHGIFLASALMLALFWQARIGWFLQLFAIAPLTGLLVASWDKVGERLKGRPRFWAEAGMFCLFGLFPMVLLPAAYHDQKFMSDVLLFPVARAESACPLKPVAEFIAEPWALGSKRHTIISGSGEGAELLFRTPHNVIAANFDVTGNKDVYDFFNAHDDRSAHRIAGKWHADMVLVCRHYSPFYAGQDHPKLGENIFLKPGEDGTLQLKGDPRNPALIEKLVNGTPPNWLKAIEIPGVTDYLLFQIEDKQ